jgi:hypothetical protein
MDPATTIPEGGKQGRDGGLMDRYHLAAPPFPQSTSARYSESGLFSFEKFVGNGEVRVVRATIPGRPL